MSILIALIPAIAWGSIGLVSGKLGGNAYQQTLGMTIGALIFGFGTYFVLHPTLNTVTWIIGILSGLFWALGQSQQFQAMKNMGVSRAVPMSTGMQLVGNTLAGAILFHEWTSGRDYTLGTIALLVLVLGATLTSREDPHKKNYQTAENDVRKGISALLISTLGYVLYTIVVDFGQHKYGISTVDFVLPQSIGMIIGAAGFAYGHEAYTSKFTFKNIVTGLFWGVGNVAMLMSIPKVGLATSYSLSQMGIIISTLGSIYLLGEKKTKREMVYVVSGCLLVIAGGVLLGIMKA
ncbi:glucose uptake protein [Lactobacillus selangorensis]|uniref:Glucose uptake protein n=1 Tax=Lactobacillus selangorensis TaxID=81857 RepID=A0A0R2FTQ2_9LACO|nr:GRP family sugar transporter [Lactobacillus selangorensis]KRN29261.1 glucose uptake protein [Lactobacillus selangorensis]KRN29781.1 glucose uptake protein [Lactobacillus selangorensis]